MQRRNIVWGLRGFLVIMAAFVLSAVVVGIIEESTTINQIPLKPTIEEVRKIAQSDGFADDVGVATEFQIKYVGEQVFYSIKVTGKNSPRSAKYQKSTEQIWSAYVLVPQYDGHGVIQVVEYQLP